MHFLCNIQKHFASFFSKKIQKNQYTYSFGCFTKFSMQRTNFSMRIIYYYYMLIKVRLKL